MSTPRRVPPYGSGYSCPTFGMMAGFIIVTLPQMLAAQGFPAATLRSPSPLSLHPASGSSCSRRFLMCDFAAAPTPCFLASGRRCHRVYRALPLFQGRSEAVMLIGYISLALFGAAHRRMDGRPHRKGAGQPPRCLGHGIATSAGRHRHPAFRLCHAAPVSVSRRGTFFPSSFSRWRFFFIPAPAPDGTLAGESFIRFTRKSFHCSSAARSSWLLSCSLCHRHRLPLPMCWAASARTSTPAPALSVSLAVSAPCWPALWAVCWRRPWQKNSRCALYLVIGLVGAGFTLSLCSCRTAPEPSDSHFSGKTSFRPRPSRRDSRVIYEVIGPGNPLAATIFALLTASMNFPSLHGSD